MVTHRQILTAVWGSAHENDTQYLRVYVGQLRQKIEPPSDPRFILTEPGIGYRLLDAVRHCPSRHLYAAFISAPLLPNRFFMRPGMLFERSGLDCRPWRGCGPT